MTPGELQWEETYAFFSAEELKTAGYIHVSVSNTSVGSRFAQALPGGPAPRGSVFATAVRKRDEEAVQTYLGASKRNRDEMRCKFMAEQRNMGRGDRESKIFQQIDSLHEQLRSLKAEKLGVSIPMPKFRTGQSVLQWWAPWMKRAEVTPSTYNRGNRPAWFSAEVCSYKAYETIRYAGQETTGNTYNVY